MLERICIEALLVDENLADQVWEMWNAGIITDGLAAWAWWCLVINGDEAHSHFANQNLA